MASQPPVSYLNQLFQWMRDPSIPMFGRWQGFPEGGAEGGVDLPSPGGTPVYALATGWLLGAGNFWHNNVNVYSPVGNPGYGVVTERVNVPGAGLQDLYYQHIQISPLIHPCMSDNCGGQVVQKGQLLGWVTPGVNEVEMGFNPSWGGIWGTNHPGPWATDPRPMLASLVEAGGGMGSGPSGGQGTCGNCDWVKCATFMPDLVKGDLGAVGQDCLPCACWVLGPSGQNIPQIPGASFLSGVLDPNTYVKIGLVVFGAILILIALMEMFK